MKSKKDWFIFVVILELIIVVLLVVFLGGFTLRKFQYEVNDILLSVDADNYQITDYVERITPEIIEPLSEKYPSIINEDSFTDNEKKIIYSENMALMNNIENDINNNSLKKHPIADYQFAGAISAETKAVTEEVTINSKFYGIRSLGIYAAPGEILTVNFPKEVVNKGITIRIGYASENSNLETVSSEKRLPVLTKLFSVTNETMKIGTPYGGLVYLYLPSTYTGSNFKLSISGGIPSAVYTYGSSNLEIWNEIKRYDSPFIEFRAGTLRFVLPSKYAIKINNPDEILKFWYFTSTFLNSLVGNEKRLTPICLIFSEDMPLGSTITHINSSFSIMSSSLVSNLLDINYVLENGSYEVIKELCNLVLVNNSWGLESDLDANIEALLAGVYMMYTNVASFREEKLMLSEKKYFADPYNTLFNLLNSDDNKALNTYVTLMNSFGVSSLTNLINCYSNTDLILELPESVSKGSWSALCYFTSNVYQKNMVDFFTKIVNVNIDQDVIKNIEQRNYDYYLPVANLYTLGYDIAKTGRPFYIPYGENYIFDFKKYMIVPNDNYSFSISGFNNGRLTSLGNGIYSYKLFEGFSSDSFNLKLEFKSSDNVATNVVNLYGEIVQDESNNVIKRYNNINSNDLDYVLLHNMLKDNEAIKIRNKGIKIISDETEVSPCYNFLEGKIIPKQSGRYLFFIKGGDYVDFYFGNEMDSLEKKAFIRSESSIYNIYNKESQFSIVLQANKEYYFKLYNYSENNCGNAAVGWITPDKIVYKENLLGEVIISLSRDQIVDVPDDVIYHKDLTTNISPKLRMYENINYSYRSLNISNVKYLDKKLMDVIRIPENSVDFDPSVIVDGDISTSCKIPMKKDENGVYIPHEYVIDLGREYTFNYIEIVVNEPATFKVTEYDIAIASSIDNFKQVITGVNTLDVTKIHFSKTSGRYIRIKINKTANYYTNISEINVGTMFNVVQTIPNTSSRLTYLGEWNINNNGLFANGSVFEGNGKVTFEFKGTTLVFYAKKGPDYQTLKLSIDGNDPTTISLNSEEEMYQELVYLINNLENKEHKVEIESDSFINIDYFVIE